MTRWFQYKRKFHLTAVAFVCTRTSPHDSCDVSLRKNYSWTVCTSWIRQHVGLAPRRAITGEGCCLQNVTYVSTFLFVIPQPSDNSGASERPPTESNLDTSRQIVESKPRELNDTFFIYFFLRCRLRKGPRQGSTLSQCPNRLNEVSAPVRVTTRR